MSMAPGGGGWYMLHGLLCPIADSQGVPLFLDGDTITMTVHMYAPDEDFSFGTFAQLNLAREGTNFTENIEYNMYEEAVTEVDPIYGYEYKALSLSWTMDDSIQNEADIATAEKLQVRVRGFNLVTTNLYYVSVDCNGDLIYEADGETIFNASHENPDNVSSVEAPADTAPIALKAAAADHPEGAKVLEGLGKTLPAGQYQYEIDFSNRALAADADLLERFTVTGAGEPIEATYSKSDMLDHLLITLPATEDQVIVVDQTHRFDRVVIPFTLEEEAPVGLTVHFEGKSDLYVQSIRLIKELTPKERDAQAVDAAIRRISPVTAENYTQMGPVIEAAEEQYNEFVAAYSQADADSLITGAADLKAARAEYDRLVKEAEEARKAAIQKAIDAITAIGPVDEITADKVEEIKLKIEAAEAAVNELTAAYGQEILSEVTNYDDLQAAKEAITLVTRHHLGDMNSDKEVNASDALIVLQYTVQLIELDDLQKTAGEVSGDQKINATDALYILQYTVDLIQKFPNESTSMINGKQ